MQARAAILENTSTPLVVRTIDLPELKRGQVLVKILFSGVCRSQLMEVRGGRGEDPWIPHLLGHEASGIVLAVGEGVTKVKKDDAVILGWIKGEGLDADGAIYNCEGRKINSGRVSTFSNYSIVSENRLVHKPEGLSFDVAVLFGCALPTGAGMVLNEIKPKPHESVVVLGLGGIGLSAVAALKALGVEKIIAADVVSQKLAMARSFGATHVLDSSDTQFNSKVFELTGNGADFCIESAGQVATIEMGYSLVRKAGGQLLFASHPPEGQFIRLAPHDLISGKKIAGSWGGGVKPDSDIPKMSEVFLRARFDFMPLLTKRYALDQVNEALNDLESGQVFRPLLVMEH